MPLYFYLPKVLSLSLILVLFIAYWPQNSLYRAFIVFRWSEPHTS